MRSLTLLIIKNKDLDISGNDYKVYYQEKKAKRPRANPPGTNGDARGTNDGEEG